MMHRSGARDSPVPRPRRRMVGGQTVILVSTIVLLLILVGYPLARIVYQSFRFDDHLSIQNYVRTFTDPRLFSSLRNSLTVSISTMMYATTLGTALAWIVGRTDLPMKRVFRTAFIIPFLIPPFIGALAWMQLLGPVGFLNSLYGHLFNTETILWNIYGQGGIILVLVMHLYPLVYITMLGSFERMNPELEEAGQISGSGIFSVMRRITIPLMLPAIGSAAVLSFIMALANFGVPSLLGFPANYYVLPTRIYNAVARSVEPNTLSLAAAMSVFLGCIAGAGLLLQRLYIKKREYAVLSGKSIQPNIVRLGKHTIWILPACIVVVLGTSIAPLVAVTLTALTDVYGLPPTPGNWTLQNFHDVFLVNRAARRAIRNSVFLAVAAATAISILGALISYIVVKTRLAGRQFLDVMANMPYALPGTVVAVGMILVWLRPVPIVGIQIYNTIWILLIAYIARYLAFGVRTTTASLSQIHVSLEEVARISGAGWTRTFKDVIIPLIVPGLFAGWFMVFIPSIRELTLSALLWSPRNETIGVMVFNLQEQGDSLGSAALALILVITVLLANIAVRIFTKGKIGY